MSYYILIILVIIKIFISIDIHYWVCISLAIVAIYSIYSHLDIILGKFIMLLICSIVYCLGFDILKHFLNKCYFKAFDTVMLETLNSFTVFLFLFFLWCLVHDTCFWHSFVLSSVQYLHNHLYHLQHSSHLVYWCSPSWSPLHSSLFVPSYSDLLHYCFWHSQFLC